MTDPHKITTYAVTDALRVYENGKLVAEIPPSDWGQLAYALLSGMRRLGQLNPAPVSPPLQANLRLVERPET